MTNSSQLRFGHDDWLLLGNALNEVTHGFRVHDFERIIGVSKSELEKLLDHLQTLAPTDDLVLDQKRARAVRNALHETIRELGVEEFHTRTGYEFEQGKAILAKLDNLLSA